MAPKRPHDRDAAESAPKKHRSGFKVGPDNLPDGIHRRKVIKIKKDLIHKAKVKKSYAKLLAQEPPTASTIPEPHPEPASQELHPSRQAMLAAPQETTPPPSSAQHPPRERRQRKPRYFEKEEAYAAQRKAEAEAKREEYERREKEKREKIEERDRFRKAMAKARTGGKNGQRKLGRESKVLLEKVKRAVGS
ncbi:hypothetical protein GLAREA_01726 [Glarea lozoyensis ATCC 20868]|uniref:rRNA-processing protein FYV7 n=1 Tax=Glarea lozoyensis (strain ATCC 20868 / MF5171) TaxID=1116229 RepID=S3CKV2_GLAL2|nr:uncharacterized protein GLAREA_01726 [Glarea lozoyensis ATCC 20868]EPE25814.1 hypothetical protein GLAREA_01726 [Glarea lozoyensis ATCC 20868]